MGEVPALELPFLMSGSQELFNRHTIKPLELSLPRAGEALAVEQLSIRGAET